MIGGLVPGLTGEETTGYLIMAAILGAGLGLMWWGWRNG